MGNLCQSIQAADIGAAVEKLPRVPLEDGAEMKVLNGRAAKVGAEVEKLIRLAMGGCWPVCARTPTVGDVMGGRTQLA